MPRSLVWTLYACLVVIWSSTWVAIKIGLEDLPPLLGAGIRFALAGAGLRALGRTAEARAALEQAVKLDPKSELALTQLAELGLKGQGDRPRARDDARLARLVEANVIATHAYQVLLARKSGKGDAACYAAGKLSDAIAARGQGFIAVSGGSTPALLFAELSRAAIDWGKVIVTFASLMGRELYLYPRPRPEGTAADRSVRPPPCSRLADSRRRGVDLGP